MKLVRPRMSVAMEKGKLHIAGKLFLKINVPVSNRINTCKWYFSGMCPGLYNLI